MTELKVTLSIDKKTADALSAIADSLAAIAANGGSAPAAPVEDEAPAPKPKPAKAAKPKPEPEPEPEVEEADDVDFDEGAEAPELTVEDVRAELKAHAALHDKASAVNILKTVGKATSIADLPEENYQAVIDALKKEVE